MLPEASCHDASGQSWSYLLQTSSRVIGHTASNWQKKSTKCQISYDQCKSWFSLGIWTGCPLKNVFLSLVLSNAQPPGQRKGANFNLCVQKTSKVFNKQLSNWTHYLNTKIHQVNLLIWPSLIHVGLTLKQIHRFKKCHQGQAQLSWQ